MQKQVGHDKDIIVGSGYKICYGKHRSHGWGWFFVGGRFTKNESVANLWGRKLLNFIAVNS